jgi:hypothetical protein
VRDVTKARFQLYPAAAFLFAVIYIARWGLLPCGTVRAQSDDEWDTAIGQLDQVTLGRVAYWAMRNSGTTVYDEYGVYNGTASGGVTFNYTHGAVGYGAQFDGVNDYISCATAPIIPIATTSYSVCGWVKVATTNANRTVLDITEYA